LTIKATRLPYAIGVCSKKVGLKIELLHYAQDFPSSGPTMPVAFL
jgi:hypothetical protein